MAKPIKDTEYLYASARIKSIEKNLLSRERLERMIDARSLEDALKLLSESGWPEITDYTMPAVESVLSDRRSEAFALIRSLAPDGKLADIFLIKYDYHNLKTLLKSELTGENPDDLVIDNGIFPCRQLKVMLQENHFAAMGERMAESVAEARDVLARTQDPQLLDLILDKAMYADMLDLATAFGSAFLENYIILSIDSANLRTVVRLQRMGKGSEILRHALIPGGSVSVSRLLGDITADVIEGAFGASSLAAAAAAGAGALRGENSLASLDLACDNTLLKYLKAAKYVAFGAEPLIGYILAIEAELISVRTVISGRLAGLAADMISERLRETYV
ncbi:MAG: V-type ATPase subunit [Clostridiales bacterium]|nr:V-type ATPase subunit [Clostridiales bacterium]